MEDIDPEAIPDMWSDCFLLSINDRRDGSAITTTYDYTGDNLRSLFVEETGIPPYLVTLPPDKLARVYQEMCMTHLPVVENVEAYHHKGHAIKFRQCLLPMGNKSITGIFGGMRCQKL